MLTFQSFAFPTLSPSAWTVAVFGFAATMTGLQGLISPSAAVKGFGVKWIRPSERAATDLSAFYQGSFSLGAVHVGK